LPRLQIHTDKPWEGGAANWPRCPFPTPGRSPGTSLADIFPALAVDPTNGNLYAVWSDGHTVRLSSSSDQGSHWTSPVTVSHAPANTALLPWVAAYNGIVDVVYYGTSAASNLDPAAAWHVYMAQVAGGSSTQRS
jgi:hypothetical protein